MKKQRGISDWWLLAIVALALICAADYGFKLWSDYTTGLIAQGDKAGYDRAMKQVAQRDNEQLRVAQARIVTLEADARAHEQEDQRENMKIANQRAKEKADYEKQLAADRAAALDGSFVLRDPQKGGAAACATPGDRGATRQALGATGAGDGKAGGELSREATGFLLSEADRADDIARQLANAQTRITQDLLTCNGSP